MCRVGGPQEKDGKEGAMGVPAGEGEGVGEAVEV